MTQVVPNATVSNVSQTALTSRIDGYITRINECIVEAAARHGNSCYFWDSDYADDAVHYGIDLPTEAIAYIVALYEDAGYIVKYKRNHWSQGKRYNFYWEYAEPSVVNHTVSPISIPVNKLNLIKNDSK